jgi:hypothetical protein
MWASNDRTLPACQAQLCIHTASVRDASVPTWLVTALVLVVSLLALEQTVYRYKKASRSYLLFKRGEGIGRSAGPVPLRRNTFQDVRPLVFFDNSYGRELCS